MFLLKMQLFFILTVFLSLAFGEILQNGQVRENPYPGQTTIVSVPKNGMWKSYLPNATEISYKGRWDSKYISWWSAPGLKLGFTGQAVAISFGNYTDPSGLAARALWRLGN